MRSEEQAGHESPWSEPAAIELEDVIPIAVVIGAGCESCTESLVLRARLRGTPEAVLARTLGIVARLCSVECLVSAIGPEVVGRMRRSLETGEAALRRAHGGEGNRGCCGSHATATRGTRPDPVVR